MADLKALVEESHGLLPGGGRIPFFAEILEYGVASITSFNCVLSRRSRPLERLEPRCFADIHAAELGFVL